MTLLRYWAMAVLWAVLIAHKPPPRAYLVYWVSSTKIRTDFQQSTLKPVIEYLITLICRWENRETSFWEEKTGLGGWPRNDVKIFGQKGRFKIWSIIPAWIKIYMRFHSILKLLIPQSLHLYTYMSILIPNVISIDLHGNWWNRYIP